MKWTTASWSYSFLRLALDVSLALSCQRPCVLRRPVNPSLTAEILQIAGGQEPVLWLPLTAVAAQASKEALFCRPKNAFCCQGQGSACLPTTQTQPQETPAPCLGGSLARPGSLLIDQPLQMVSISARLSIAAELTQAGDAGSWGSFTPLQGVLRTPRHSCSTGRNF